MPRAAISRSMRFRPTLAPARYSIISAGSTTLTQRHVRFIGDPLKRIAEDHLRILRYFRFHARFGAGEPDQAALDACTRRANDLMALSRERIADELLKLLGLPDPSTTVGIMLDRGILRASPSGNHGRAVAERSNR